MTTPANSPAAQPFAQTVRTLVSTLATAPVILGIALFFTLGDDKLEEPDVVLGVVVLAIGIAAHLACEVVGYRTPAIARSTTPEEAQKQARERFNAGVFLRFAICEAVVLAGVVLAFVTEAGGMVLYAVAAVIGVGLILFHAYPWTRPVQKVQRLLEADGARTDLAGQLGVTGPLGH